MPSRHMGGVLQAPQDPIQGIETKKRNNTSLYFPVIPLEGTISASKRPYVVPFMTYGDVTDPHMLRPILPSLFRHIRPCWYRRFVLAVTISGGGGGGRGDGGGCSGGGGGGGVEVVVVVVEMGVVLVVVVVEVGVVVVVEEMGVVVVVVVVVVMVGW